MGLGLAALAGCDGDASGVRREPLQAPTYRAIAGISMGGMGATFLGAARPERFDAIASLGGPLDLGYFLSYMERQHLGGFCKLAELEAILAAHPGRPEVLDDPAMLPCMAPSPPLMSARIPERVQSFDDWMYSDNGGSFDRDSYLDLFEDLARAFGNPLSHQANSSYYAPGLSRADLDRGEALCEDPVVLRGVYNAEYNPEGRYDLISFCDGEEPVFGCRETERIVDSCREADPEVACADEGGAVRIKSGAGFRERAGVYDPCSPHRRPVPFALAVDLNGNGRRDYGEPIVLNAHERFRDVGIDGCPNEIEDGRGGCVSDPSMSPFADGLLDPNGDDFDWETNPHGTEGNLIYDEGEPFDDDGLDGVPGTGDYGEGDGRYTEAPSRLRFRLEDGRTRMRESWTEADRERMAFYADGGIRDLFNFDVSAAMVWGELAAASPNQSARYFGVSALPGSPATEAELAPFAYEEGILPRKMLYLYGDEAADPEQVAKGDGGHAGTSRQVLSRLQLLLRWISDRWTGLPDPPADRSSFWSRASSQTFVSQALGGVERDYAVVLPPGYDDPANAGVRYPVLYLLHGYGMHAAGSGGFYEQALVFDGSMATGAIRKAIVVFPSGGCCYRSIQNGEMVCTEFDAKGNASFKDPALEKLCRSGTFFVDAAGTDGSDELAYGQSFFELMDEVDARYRTLP